MKLAFLLSGYGAGTSMFSFFVIVDFAVLAFGIYILISTGMMMQKNQAPQWLLQKEEFRKVKDKESFCKDMFPSSIGLGIVCTAYGVISALNTFIFGIYILEIIEVFALLLIVVWYALIYRKAKSKCPKW